MQLYIFLPYEYPGLRTYVNIDQGIHRVKTLQKMKNGKKITWGFLYYAYDIAKFEAFHQNISMSANLLFLKNNNICSR